VEEGARFLHPPFCQTSINGQRIIVRILKPSLILVACLLFIATTDAYAQDPEQRAPMEVLQDALRRGDTNALASISSDRVEVTLFNSAAMYSRGQAMYVLADFFRQYPPVRISFSEGSRAGANWFVMGEYSYEGGDQSLRLFVRMRSKDGRPELRELRIDRRGGP
jgi:hypothetical protein